RCPIINLSGGTEVGACVLSPLPITSLKPSTLRGPALGMDIDVWGPDGQPVAPGDVGELVCKKPWPAMTRGIWRNPQRYLETYWSRWPDVWVHGDRAGNGSGRPVRAGEPGRPGRHPKPDLILAQEDVVASASSASRADSCSAWVGGLSLRKCRSRARATAPAMVVATAPTSRASR